MSDMLLKDIHKHQRFGSLIAIDVVVINHRTLVRCRCDCGIEEDFPPHSLRTKKRVRCSSCHTIWIHDRSHLIVDHSGERRGKVLLLERLKTKGDRKVRYRCACDCGTEFITYATHLDKLKSCGCLRVGKQTRRGQYTPVESAWRRLYATYRHSAYKRGLKFDVELQEFIRLCSDRCWYCGEEPSKKFWCKVWCKGKQTAKERAIESQILVNGLDRIDPNLGYIDGNIVSCCTRCNYAKHVMTLDEFKMWIIKVYERLI